jgi:hypothetical protein
MDGRDLKCQGPPKNGRKVGKIGGSKNVRQPSDRLNTAAGVCQVENDLQLWNAGRPPNTGKALVGDRRRACCCLAAVWAGSNRRRAPRLERSSPQQAQIAVQPPGLDRGAACPGQQGLRLCFQGGHASTAQGKPHPATRMNKRLCNNKRMPLENNRSKT